MRLNMSSASVSTVALNFPGLQPLDKITPDWWDMPLTTSLRL